MVTVEGTVLHRLRLDGPRSTGSIEGVGNDSMAREEKGKGYGGKEDERSTVEGYVQSGVFFRS